jgi:hypothetical protein
MQGSPPQKLLSHSMAEGSALSGFVLEMFFDRLTLPFQTEVSSRAKRRDLLFSLVPVISSLMEALPSPLSSSRAQPRDLQFNGIVLEMF